MRRVVVLGSACLLGLAGLAAAQPAPAAAPSAQNRSRVLVAAQQLMQRSRYCTFVTLGRDGHPQARIVDPFAPERDMTIWIATNPLTRKVEEIKRDPRVTLLYFDSAGPGYVTMLAKAELVSDPAEKARHWKDDWVAFYADKNRGADFALIRCKPIRLELVSYAHGLLNDPKTWRPISIDFP